MRRADGADRELLHVPGLRAEHGVQLARGRLPCTEPYASGLT